jgi:hypothetical protein
VFLRDAFAELGRKSARRQLRREATQHDQARQRALAAVGERAWQLQLPLSPAERQSLGAIDGQAGALAQHLGGLQAEAARLDAQRTAEIARNAHQQVIAELDKTLYRLRSEISAKSSATSAAGNQRIAILAQLGGSLYAQGRRDPPLAPLLGEVAAIDQARATTAAAMQTSQTASAAMPRGTMGKFWGSFMLVFVGGIVAISIATSKSSSPSNTRTASSTTKHAVVPFKPFTADEEVSGIGPKHTVKLYATETAMRSEGVENDTPFIMIFRLDKNVVWMLSPATQTYVELEIPMGAHSMPVMATDDPSCKIVGEAEIAGYHCSRQTCELPMGKRGNHETTRWVSEDLGGLVLKLHDSTTTIELKNIQFGNQARDLFELPTGYHL